MPKRKKLDEKDIFESFERKRTPPNMILTHCKIKFDERNISGKNDKNREVFDLYQEDLQEECSIETVAGGDENAENLAYVNLLLGTLMIIEYRYRKIFIIYQACKQSDPIRWLDSVMQVMTTYHQDISAYTHDSETFYDTTLSHLNDVRALYIMHHKKDQLSVSWNGGPIQFVELVLALYQAEKILTYGPDIKDEKALISAMAHKFNFKIDDIFNYIESIKGRKDIKGRGDKKARFLLKLIDSLIAYCNDSDAR